jgi:hypothetical protein
MIHRRRLRGSRAAQHNSSQENSNSILHGVFLCSFGIANPGKPGSNAKQSRYNGLPEKLETAKVTIAQSATTECLLAWDPAGIDVNEICAGQLRRLRFESLGDPAGPARHGGDNMEGRRNLGRCAGDNDQACIC